MADIEEKLHELDEWYADTSDVHVADVQSLDCVRQLYYDVLEQVYGRVPQFMRRRFEHCLVAYESLSHIMQRRFRGVLANAAVLASVAKRKDEAAGLVLAIAQMLPSAFSGLDERKEEALICELRRYLAGGLPNPVGPSIEETLTAARDALQRNDYK